MNRDVKVSKYLAKHLRHSPEELGLKLQPGGWVSVDDLLEDGLGHQKIGNSGNQEEEETEGHGERGEER